jgi:EpsI family protein
MNGGAPALLPSTRRRAFVIAASMLATSGLTVLARPQRLLAAQGPRLDLESLIPTGFGSWRIDTAIVPIQPSPDVLDRIEAIYDATLGRTYVNRQGDRVMLSIAYGGDQTGRLRVHRPESCYSAQGYAVRKVRDEVADYGGVTVPLKRLHSRLGARSEPITYWIRVGSATVTGNVGQRLAQLEYAIAGVVPDGLIFRVSSIDTDVEAAYRVQDAFIRDLIASVDADAVERLVGKPRHPS